ncbi:YceD family protein [Sinimarinibacterium thermocellulolyticum]|uniref:Large ribosomal RNA subunit accumulation protein YceD n=1 Tax=Sinimarinibacterium thermocellulolyticum TaxID=3170016 RepID=A0ABV2AAZ3_9GAMM
MGLAVETRASLALEREHRYVGQLSVSQCARLVAELVAGADTALQVELQADRRSGWPRLHGRIVGALMLECRRCGRPFEQALELAVDLRLVFGEAEERAALAKAEPLLIEDDRLPLWQVVEDEVLLALPMLPRCQSCENVVNEAAATAARPQEQQAPAPRDNPFAALKRHLQSKE